MEPQRPSDPGTPGERLSRPSGRAAAVLVVLFASGLGAPLVRWAITGERDRSALEEQREPAPEPELALDRATLEALPEAATAWFQDAFPFRRELVRTHNAALWFGLGDSPSDLMLRGRDDWLFLRSGRALDVHRGLLLEDAALEAWVQRYLDWRDWLAARDADYLLLIAPEKQDIYPEQLPAWAGARPARTRTDQFVERARERGLAVVHPRAELVAAKTEGLVYYPLGTHWNGAGAFVAYEALVAGLARFQPLQRPLPRARFELLGDSHPLVDPDRDDTTAQMLLADLVDQPVRSWVQRPPLPWTLTSVSDPGREPSDVVTTIPDQRFPRAVLAPDSFGQWLWPYLANHFSRLHSNSGVRFPVELVERERPEVVLSVRVERLLTEGRPTPLDLSAEELDRARAWNGAAAVAVERAEAATADAGWRLGGEGRGRLWLRAERALALEAGPEDAPTVARGRLRGADGEIQTFELCFGQARRWAFVDVSGAVLPASIELDSDDPPLLALAGRLAPDSGPRAPDSGPRAPDAGGR